MANNPKDKDAAKPGSEKKKDPFIEPVEDLSDMELEDVAGGVAADTISVGVTWSR